MDRVRAADGQEEENRLRTDADVRMLSPLVLAYVGDAVFELYVRTRMVRRHDLGTNRLNRLTVGQVRAEGQRDSLSRVEPCLTQEELDVLRRGRNAKTAMAPKHASRADYSAATALEALVGYLYLCGREERLSQILDMALPKDI